jgi:hypothetical protein
MTYETPMGEPWPHACACVGGPDCCLKGREKEYAELLRGSDPYMGVAFDWRTGGHAKSCTCWECSRGKVEGSPFGTPDSWKAEGRFVQNTGEMPIKTMLDAISMLKYMVKREMPHTPTVLRWLSDVQEVIKGGDYNLSVEV